MKLIEIINSPWSIKPESFQEILSVYESHMKGDKIDIKGLEARIGIQFQNRSEGPYDLINGSAVIPIQGVISKKANLFTYLFGGAATEQVARNFKEALVDPSVEQIILHIDSPGGTIDGTQELATLIFESRGQKPIIAFTDGMIASAAYWIGAATDRIYISGDTVSIGSIGVITAHVDVSKMYENAGVKVTEIMAGKYKRTASMYQPLSEEGKQEIQSVIDFLFKTFVDDVARFRNVSLNHALEVWSTATPPPVFMGNQAINAGLVDGVSTLDQLINKAVGNTAIQRKEESIMTLDELKANHPELYQSVKDEVLGSEPCKSKFEAGLKEGAEAESVRIKSVKEQLIPGHEALIETLMFDGKTTGSEAAVQILAAEKKLRLVNLEAFKADGKDTAKVPVSEGGTDAIKPDADAELSDEKFEEKKKAEWDANTELRSEFGNEFSRYLSYVKADKEKKFKVLKK